MTWEFLGLLMLGFHPKDTDVIVLSGTWTIAAEAENQWLHIDSVKQTRQTTLFSVSRCES